MLNRPVPIELRQIIYNFLSRQQFSSSSQSRPFSTSIQHQHPPRSRPLKVLGLESSADDTCASIVSSDGKILSNIVLKQASIHESFGGIHPMFAQESHQKFMPIAIQRALKEAGDLKLKDLDAIAFTKGPGMYGCLSVCAGSAKALAAANEIPLIGVHHMQAHALTPFLTEAIPPTFPFLTLLLSGGHTLLLLARSESDFKILATTADESIGASLDKVCRDLKIPWSLGGGCPGAALEAYADFDLSSPSTTYPLAQFVPPKLALAFSFAGLRSAMTRILRKEPVDEMNLERKRTLARAFFSSAFGQVESKVGLALKSWEESEGINGQGVKLGGLVVSGGVASNMWLRARLRHKLDSLGYQDLRLIFPPPSLCTDNAAMIAYVGLRKLERKEFDPLTVMQRPKWSLEDLNVEVEV